MKTAFTVWAVILVFVVQGSALIFPTVHQQSLLNDVAEVLSEGETSSFTCLTNLTVAVGSFLPLNTNTLGDDLCTVIGSDDCISVTFQSTVSSLVPVLEASLVPGVKDPQVVQKMLSVHEYTIEAVNRTKALSSIINAARYASSLSKYQCQSVTVGAKAVVYERASDPILSYIGNTSQCLSHFWYLIFFIVCAPILAFGCHYCYKRGKRDYRDRLSFGLLPNPALIGNGESSSRSAGLTNPGYPYMMLDRTSASQSRGVNSNAARLLMAQQQQLLQANLMSRMTSVPQFSPQSMQSPQTATI